MRRLFHSGGENMAFSMTSNRYALVRRRIASIQHMLNDIGISHNVIISSNHTNPSN